MSYPWCVFNRVIAILFFATVLAGTGCQRERSFETSEGGVGNLSGNGLGAGIGNEEGTGAGNEDITGTVNVTSTGTVSGTSKFILVPTGGHCSDAVIHGSYTDRTPLT